MSGDLVNKNIRSQLILAGIREINKYGIQGFSVRRIANECGVSCAAPYKHFKDRQSFFAAIIDYINCQWHERQQAIILDTSMDSRKKLVEISLEYIRFLVEYPHYRSIIMLKDEEFDSIYKKTRGKLSDTSKEMVNNYCDEMAIPEETKARKLYIVRSLIYGAALMFDNGELEYTEENMDIVKYSINREFDLP